MITHGTACVKMLQGSNLTWSVVQTQVTYYLVIVIMVSAVILAIAQGNLLLLVLSENASPVSLFSVILSVIGFSGSTCWLFQSPF